MVGGTFTVDADGASAVTFSAVDGAGNEGQTTATVKIDRSAPVAVVSCTPGAGIITSARAAVPTTSPGSPP